MLAQALSQRLGDRLSECTVLKQTQEGGNESALILPGFTSGAPAEVLTAPGICEQILSDSVECLFSACSQVSQKQDTCLIYQALHHM